MYQIGNERIDPELRAVGRIARRMMPSMGERTFRAANVALKVLKGRGAKGLRYRQVRIARDAAAGAGELRLCVYQPEGLHMSAPACDGASGAAGADAAPGDSAWSPSVGTGPAAGGAPGFLWIHGGGYCLGTPEMDAGFIRELVETCGCTVVSPDYRLAVEAPYPAALLDCYAALTWMRDNAGRLGVRSDQLMVGGESAGGGLAAALCIYARDRGEVSIAFQLPLYPMLDDRMITPSSRDNDAPLWNTRSNEEGWRLYLGELYRSDGVPAYAAPARLEDVSGLPPAYTFVGDIDPFHDETVQFVERLRRAGVPAECDVCPGCYHGFDVVRPSSQVARAAHARMRQQLEYAVGHYFKAQP